MSTIEERAFQDIAFLRTQLILKNERINKLETALKEKLPACQFWTDRMQHIANQALNNEHD